jgi:hypothetical protein
MNTISIEDDERASQFLKSMQHPFEPSLQLRKGASNNKDINDQIDIKVIDNNKRNLKSKLETPIHRM